MELPNVALQAAHLIERHDDVYLLVLQRGTNPIERHNPIVFQSQHVLSFLNYCLDCVVVGSGQGKYFHSNLEVKMTCIG